MYQEQNIFTGKSVSQEALKSFLNRVFGWMGAGLLVTALTAHWVIANIGIINPMLFFGAVIAELFLVYRISRYVMNMNLNTATGMFVFYSALNGFTLSGLAFIYTSESLASTFISAAGLFGVMAFYGAVTKKDLSSWGSFLFMGLIGIVLSTIVNIFIGSGTFQMAISAIGVLVFTGLTAYDVQSILNSYEYGDQESDAGGKKAILGALKLYLDFINLFIMLLRLFGDRRN